MERLKEEVLQTVQDDLIHALRGELAKSISDKFKESLKHTDKGNNELREQISSFSSEIEDLKLALEVQSKDGAQKNDKFSKQLREEREYLEEQFQHFNENLTVQLEKLKKRVMKDIKAEFDVK